MIISLATLDQETISFGVYFILSVKVQAFQCWARLIAFDILYESPGSKFCLHASVPDLKLSFRSR